jgi:type II secretory pathway component PulF
MASKLATVYDNLSVMLDAGLPMLKTLNIATEGLQGQLKIIFTGISKSVSQGKSLADSMDKYPRNFAKLDLMLIRSAELSGELPRCFKMLSNWYEFTNRMKRIILSGLFLPILIFHIFVFVVPLPYLVLGGISINQYFTRVGIGLGILYLLIGISIIAYHLIYNEGFLRKPWDAMILRIPAIGLAVYELSICRYCRGFNLLYKAGLPIKECATQATELTGNMTVSDMFKGGVASIEAGKTAYEGLSRKLPKEYLELWYIGEETGELDKTVDKIAEISGDRAEHMLTEIAKWTPRILYALVCIILIIQIFRTALKIYTVDIT